MDCYRPLRIKNQYNGKFLHVDCRSCPACLVRSANLKCQQLSVTLSQYKYKYFLTLTYDNDSVPYILPNMMSVFRGQGIDDFPEVIGYLNEPVPIDLDWLYLRNHAVTGAVGVIWYEDIKLFFKRFRKYINKHYGKRKFGYFAVCEYGSFYGRPHAHIVIYSDELLFDECQTAAFACWSYHDWNKFFKDGTNEACKRCDEGCSAYISSYVNCNTNNVQISNFKQFRQRTCRSKNLYFGLERDLLDSFKKDVVRIANNVVQDGGRKVFYYTETEQINNVSSRLLPSRYVYAVFHKFKEWSEVSFDVKLSRAYDIINRCQKLRRYGKSLGRYDFRTSDKGIIYNIEQASDDLSFYRAYVRFNLIFDDYLRSFIPSTGYKDLRSYENREMKVFFSIYDYLILMEKVLTYYKSCLLYEQMKTYETLGKDNYYLSLIDTSVEVPEKRGLMLLNKVKGSVYKNVDINCPPMVRTRLDEYVSRYKKRLLVKHLNDKSNILKD